MRQKVGKVSRKLPKWQVAKMVFGRSDLKAKRTFEAQPIFTSFFIKKSVIKNINFNYMTIEIE